MGDIEPEEVIKLVQKGQNHDRIQEQLEPFREIAELWSKMGQELKLDGMAEAMMNDVFKRLAEVNKTTPDIERRTHELDVREKRAKIEKELQDQRAREAAQKENKSTEMYRRFAKEFPDVKPSDLPKEVKQAVKER